MEIDGDPEHYDDIDGEEEEESKNVQQFKTMSNDNSNMMMSSNYQHNDLFNDYAEQRRPLSKKSAATISTNPNIISKLKQ